MTEMKRTNTLAALVPMLLVPAILLGQQRTLVSPASDPSLQMRVATAPTLTIGVQAGQPEYELFRVSDARVLSDGRIVVANSGTSQIRFYDSNGRFLTSHGSSGQGPGEYRVINGIHVFSGDSLAVFDQFNQRVSIIDSRGNLMRTISLSNPRARGVGGRYSPVGYSGSSMIVTHGGTAYSSRDSTQVTRDSMRLSVFDPSDRSVDPPFFEYVDTENFVWSNGQSVSVSGLPFGRATYIATNGDSVVVAENDGFSFKVVSVNSGAVSTITLQHVPQRITSSMVDNYKGNALGSLPEAFRASRRQALSETPFPTHVASYDKLLVDELGAVWLRETPLDTEEATWFVFTGEQVRWLTLPASFEITQANDEWVLGVMSDELGVETVVRMEFR